MYNSRGKAVSGDPEGSAARRMVGDKGIAAHKKAVATAAKKLAKSKMGTKTKTRTTAKGTKSKTTAAKKK
ncbi:hypothetical protein D3C86_1848940 [compost metagenome]